jgi:CBS domain-containing protein
MRVVRRGAAGDAIATVRQLMAKSIMSGDPRQTLRDAAAEMRTHRISALAVLDGNAIVGIITERDLLRAIADGRNPSVTHVSQYMTHSPKTIEAAEPAARAAAVMIKQRVRHLPVTDEGRLIGFLSARDLLALNPWPRKLSNGERW